MTVTQWLLGPHLLGFIFILIGYSQKLFPARHINKFYGYRSPTSTKNQQTWDAGNARFIKLMIRGGIIAVLFGFAVAPFLNKQHQLIQVAFMLLVGIATPVTIIVMTESHLNKLFDKKTE